MGKTKYPLKTRAYWSRPVVFFCLFLVFYHETLSSGHLRCPTADSFFMCVFFFCFTLFHLSKVQTDSRFDKYRTQFALWTDEGCTAGGAQSWLKPKKAAVLRAAGHVRPSFVSLSVGTRPGSGADSAQLDSLPSIQLDQNGKNKHDSVH